MPADPQWPKIEEIYNAALERPAAERGAFLGDACGGDEELHHAVDSLLSLEQQSEGFLEPPRPVATLSAGDLVSSYRVVSKLGEGGMGEVYLAEDTRLGRQVALKVLPRELAGDLRREAQFLKEARAASALDHPNIGAIYGVEETASGQLCIVMAYHEGQTLERKLRNGPLSVQEAAVIAIQIARGLAEAHAHNLVHRDIKPSNICLTTQGLVKIIDFGIARAVQSATSTLSASIPGTLSYMSPEQAQGKLVDARTDLWALGAVLYEMITGRPAFAAEGVAATLFAIVNDPPADMGEHIPLALQGIVYRALAKRPEDRYQSAAEMIQDLRPLSGIGVLGCDPTVTVDEIDAYRKLAAAVPEPSKKRRFLNWPFALTLIVLLMALAWLIARNTSGPKPAAYESYLKAVPYMQRHEKAENLDRAIALLNGAVKADPKFALGFASLGEAYWLKSRLTKDSRLLAQAESNAKRALELNDGLARVHIVMAEVQSALGNRELAQEEYQGALKLDPSNTQALTGLAGEYAAQQRFQEAEELYRRAAALRPDSWDGYNNLGIFLKDRRRPHDAAQQFRRVIELSPDNAAGYSNLAAVLIDDSKLDEAEAPLRAAVKLAPTSHMVHLNLGWLYYRRRLFPQAEREIGRAVELDDKDWLGWIDLAAVCRSLGQGRRALAAYQRAVPLVEEAVKVNPKHASLRGTLAEVYAYTGESVKALASIQAAILLDPDNPAVLLSCADAQAALGDRKLAVATANKAVAHGLTLAVLDSDPEAFRFRTDPNFKPPTR